MKVFRKIYGVFGMVEWSTLIPAGDSHIRIEFSNGSISIRGIDPATFSTENIGVQTAIELSDKFRKGKIKLINKIEIGEISDAMTPKKEVKTKIENDDKKEGGEGAGNKNEDDESTDGKQTDENGGNKSPAFPEVTNSQNAKSILMAEPYNVSLADLPNKAAIQAKAVELNISFPNWN